MSGLTLAGQHIDILERRGREHVERPATCARCGKPFVQFKLSDAFRVAAGRYGRALANGVPGGWVPLYCPHDERRELASGILTVPAEVTPALDLAYETDERAALREA